MPTNPGRIETRWREIGEVVLDADSAALAAELAAIAAAYAEPGRHYHDGAHIEALLALSQAHRGALIAPETVDLAIHLSRRRP